MRSRDGGAEQQKEALVQLIEKITVSLTTFNPMRRFPERGYCESWKEAQGDEDVYLNHQTFISGWMESIEQLHADEILIIEKAEAGKHCMAKRYPWNHVRVIEAPNDPPFADPFRQQMLDEAKNDWVLQLDDDERVSPQMATFLASLGDMDPAPTKPWAAIRFPREDYIFHKHCWRYIPANGDDHQMRLLDRRRVKVGSKPHSIPEPDGAVLTITSRECSILHYRSFDKITSWTDNCNRMFAHQPRIVAMQTAYVGRVRAMLGIPATAEP